LTLFGSERAFITLMKSFMENHPVNSIYRI
jgi:hypothetical protein